MLSAESLILAARAHRSSKRIACRKFTDEAKIAGPCHDPEPNVFVSTVDNTLLDNDRVQNDIKRYLDREFGVASRERYWRFSNSCSRSWVIAITLARCGVFGSNTRRIFVYAGDVAYLIDYPSANRLYPGSLDVLGAVSVVGQTVILPTAMWFFNRRKSNARHL